MRKLISVLADSFLIWSRNFTLIYVFLLALLLFSQIIPESEMPTLEMRWILLGVILLLLFGAVMSGWFNMVALACDRFLGRPREQVLKESSPLDALTLFQAFLPGIGRYFAPMLGGYLIQVVMAVLLMLPVQPLWAKNSMVIEKMAKLSVDGRMHMLMNMKPDAQNSFMSFSTYLLGGLLAYVLFSLMTMLWPAFVIYYQNNPLKACYRSMVQFFKDPLSMVVLCLLVIGIRVPLFFLTSAVSTSNAFLLGAGLQLINLLVEIFIAVMLFVYVYKTVGQPIRETEPAPETNKDYSEHDSHDGFGE